MIKLVLAYYDLSVKALGEKISINKLISLSVREKIGRFKYVAEQQISREYEAVTALLQEEFAALSAQEE